MKWDYRVIKFSFIWPDYTMSIMFHCVFPWLTLNAWSEMIFFNRWLWVSLVIARSEERGKWKSSFPPREQRWLEVRGWFLTLSDAGVWRLNLGRGGAESAPPPIWGTFSTLDPKNGSQPQNSPRLRCYNIKRTKKLRATCCNWHLYVLVILASYCSRQGPPLWN